MKDYGIMMTANPTTTSRLEEGWEYEKKWITHKILKQ